MAEHQTIRPSTGNKENIMRQIRVEKVVLNIGVGEAGERMERAKKVLEGFANGKKVIITKAHGRTTFGAAKGRPLGVAVTLRGHQAIEFLKKALDAIDKKLPGRVFDRQGNFSFGVKEHIGLSGTRYDPEIGIWGFDVAVRLARRGYRISKKRIAHRVGMNHRITPIEAREWSVNNLGIKVEE